MSNSRFSSRYLCRGEVCGVGECSPPHIWHERATGGLQPAGRASAARRRDPGRVGAGRRRQSGEGRDTGRICCCSVNAVGRILYCYSKYGSVNTSLKKTRSLT